MFRPRFRLSLLFVVVALVAGVSVWLRQAVVRDRNIRELLAEDWAIGTAHPEVTSLNTRILNYFFAGQTYCDKIYSLQIYIHQIKTPESFLKYQDLDLGISLERIFIRARDEEDSRGCISFNKPDTTIPRKNILLSQVFFFLGKFSAVEYVDLDWATIVDDIAEPPKLDCHCQELVINFSNVDAIAVLKLIKAVHLPPQNLFLKANQIRGSLKVFEDSGLFPDEQIWVLKSHNDYSEKRE